MDFLPVPLQLVLSFLVAYLLGGLPTGTAVAKFYGGPNLRKIGSGNIGMTNVMRSMGWKSAALTFLGDTLKGVIAALLGKWIGGTHAMIIASAGVILGHDFPVYFKFKGGKGISTSLGVTIVLCPLVAPFLVLIVIPIVAITKMMSAGTLSAAAAFPFLYWWLTKPGPDQKWFVIFAALNALLAMYCHRANLVRLFTGKENKLDFHKINTLTKKYRMFHRNNKED